MPDENLRCVRTFKTHGGTFTSCLIGVSIFGDHELPNRDNTEEPKPIIVDESLSRDNTDGGP